MDRRASERITTKISRSLNESDGGDNNDDIDIKNAIIRLRNEYKNIPFFPRMFKAISSNKEEWYNSLKII